MQRVFGSLILGLSLFTLGRAARAEPVQENGFAIVDSTSTEPTSTEPTSTTYGQCSEPALEQYARRRAFTTQLIEERERQQFEAEVSAYERRRQFTLWLTQQRKQLTEAERKQFDQDVERHVRLYEVTLRIQDERDLRDANAFANDLAVQERKRAFTRQLVEARNRGTGSISTSTPSGAEPK